MKIYKNILKEDDKKKIFKFIKKEVEDLGGSYPCLQTPNNIHLKSEMKSFVESVQKYIKPYKIHKCWGVCSVGNIICWHNPPDCKYSFVYYLHNPSEDGTIFLESSEYYDVIKHTEGIENSLLKFDNLQKHSIPLTPKKIKRYTIAFDII